MAGRIVMPTCDLEASFSFFVPLLLDPHIADGLLFQLDVAMLNYYNHSITFFAEEPSVVCVRTCFFVGKKKERYYNNDDGDVANKA